MMRGVAGSLGLAALAALAACTTDFEDSSIVIDLRVLGISVEPPEIVVPFDPENPLDVELGDTEVCVLVADPGASRRLAFEMSACPPTGDSRCDDPEDPAYEFASGTIDDPDETASAPRMCATLRQNAALLEVIEASVAADSFAGFGGVRVQVQVVIRPEGGEDSEAIYASKRMLYSPKVPEERVANTNPRLERLTAARPVNGERDRDVPVVTARCADPGAMPIEVAPGEELGLIPIEPAGAREDYVLPTFDGGSRQFTENLSYAWFATGGDWGGDSTGGTKDPFGNEPNLDTTWTAPEEISEPIDIDMWVVQRDERGGLTWYQMCAHVVP
jgi:hypothetical protein